MGNSPGEGGMSYIHTRDRYRPFLGDVCANFRGFLRGERGMVTGQGRRRGGEEAKLASGTESASAIVRAAVTE